MYVMVEKKEGWGQRRKKVSQAKNKKFPKDIIIQNRAGEKILCYLLNKVQVGCLIGSLSPPFFLIEERRTDIFSTRRIRFHTLTVLFSLFILSLYFLSSHFCFKKGT